MVTSRQYVLNQHITGNTVDPTCGVRIVLRPLLPPLTHMNLATLPSWPCSAQPQLHTTPWDKNKIK